MNIVVLCGGTSSEREVSIVSGTNVAKALISKGHNARLLDVFFGTYKTNKTLSKIKDYVNELNSKNQGSTQSDSKIFSLSQNRNSFLDKNRSIF